MGFQRQYSTPDTDQQADPQQAWSYLQNPPAKGDDGLSRSGQLLQLRVESQCSC